MSSPLPFRGDGASRPTGVVVPPAKMSFQHKGRPRKHWRYVGLFGEDFELCVGQVRVGGAPQVFWAVWDRANKQLHEHTTKLRTRHVELAGNRVRVSSRDVSIDLTWQQDGDLVEVVSPHGRSYIWTLKTPIVASGTVTIGGVVHAIQAHGLVDDTDGYHARVTTWEWSAGVGTTTDGRRVAWNFVTGVHDSPTNSERTLWVDGKATEIGPVAFSAALDEVTLPDWSALRFTTESVREARENLGLVASDYRQPFGTASGTLAPGVTLAEGHGVMERHSARW